MTMTFKLASFFGIIALAYMFVKAFHSVIVYRTRYRKKSGDFELKRPNPEPKKRKPDLHAISEIRKKLDFEIALEKLRQEVKAGKIDDFTASTKLAVLTAKRMEEPDVWKPLPMAELQKHRKNE